jgi:LPXTG-motif cell wall-anchored protein
MSHRWLLRSAVGLAVAATTFVGAAAAWAATSTSPTLHQHDQHILATDAKFKQKFCSCRPDQHPNQDAWVFVWPGGKWSVGTVQSVEIGFDTNNDGTADAVKSYPAEGKLGSDNGTPKVTFLTPSGWRLETGTSVISGKVSTFNTDGFAAGFFNLTHTCPGTTTPTTPPPTSAPPTSAVPSSSAPETPEPSESYPTTEPPTTTSAPAVPSSPVETSPSTTPPDSGLPVTGAALGGVIIAGLAALVGGIILVLTMRRRRDTI